MCLTVEVLDKLMQIFFISIIILYSSTNVACQVADKTEDIAKKSINLSGTMSMMKAAQFTPGGPELLTIGEVPLPSLRPNHILVRVFATAINRADTLQRRGAYPSPPGESSILGLEASGSIHQLGGGVSRWKLGDRVMLLLAGGGNAEYVEVHESHAMSIPDSMSYVQAAAIPEVWLTAYQLLFFVGGVKSGERVLIHAGGSGVGTAAVQLASHAGAEVLVTAGSTEKIELAKSLGAAAGFNYKLANFDEQILEYTKGEGVDVILDCIGASYWEKNTNVLAVDGRWVLYGSMGGVRVEGDFLRVILRKRISLLGTLLRSRSNQYKAVLVEEFSRKAVPLFVDGTYKPIIDSVLPFTHLAQAHTNMENNVNKGKIIIQIVQDAPKHAEL